MKMTFRWYGEGNDSITLDQIKQIPGVTGIVWSLHDIPAGEEWPMDRILKEKELIESHGFNIDVVESVNVHEDIKLGLPSREKYIENYKKTIEKLGKVGVKVICYNFMPVFDWTRTDLNKKLPDGSTALFYEKAKIEKIDPIELVEKISLGVKEYTMPGWEPKRLSHLKELFKAYENVTEEDLWNNLKYFLEAIIPVCEANNVKMAIHPDDPAWSIFGLPRLIINRQNIKRFLKLVDSPYNGLTFCSGSLGSNPNNDLISIIKEFAPRIHFAHIRNIKHFENGDFIETSHKTSDGSLDVVGMVKAFYEAGFTGYVRPDHGRHLWNEKCRPGYGLYDRALGIMYLWGAWDAFEKDKKSI
ncbi:D-mannonate dehydratase [Clostridium sp. USBA 49]|uniref:mannonate dehydratase n=1 Tax=Clostridium sp. USBA 49 TaxID=1881060 RepID=UPI00099AFB0D|nr:mannonate dehydratase [Clostridium sp. USBA 49]SKA74144.1 D-mannonate dehydratase [Clostridium sp. USBA 49]